MRKIFTESFLWSIFILEVVVLVIVFILYIASSQDTLKYVLNLVTKDKNITYSSVSGTLLESITIRDIKKDGKTVAKSADISWNIKSLITKTPTINKIDLKGLNIYGVESLIPKNGSINEQNKSPLELNIPNFEIKEISISTLPYKNDLITLNSLNLSADDIISNNNLLSIKNFHFNSRTNLANLKIDGKLKDRTIQLSRLHLSRLNLRSIQELIKNLPQAGDKESNFTLIDRVEANDISISTLPYKFDRYQFSLLSLKADGLSGDLKSQRYDLKDLSIKANSNIFRIDTNGYIRENRLYLDGLAHLDRLYFNRVVKFVDFMNLNPIKLRLELDRNGVDANVTLRSKQIFKERFKDYQTSINNLKSDIHFDFKTKKLEAFTDANISNKYANSLILKDHLTYKDGLKYGGEIEIKELKHFPKNSLALFKDATIYYKANEANLTADLNTSKLHLLYKMQNYKRADFKLDSKELNISKYFNIPDALKDLKAKCKANMSLDFARAKDLKIRAKIDSNALNLNGLIWFKDGVFVDSNATLSKNSILYNIDKKIKFDALFASKLQIHYKDQKIDITNKNENLLTTFKYDLNTTKTLLTTKLDSDEFSFDGNIKKLIFNTKILSLKEAQKKLAKIYDFKPIPLDGEIDLNSTISDLKDFEAKISSRWLVYEYSLNKFAFAEKINLNMHKKDENIIIDNYKLSAFIAGDNRDLFATKPSIITLNDKSIKLQELWINDSLKSSGFYDIATSSGEFRSSSSSFKYSGKEGRFTTKIDLATKILPDKTSIKGAITILQATITYKYKNTHEVSDPDIIIIQEQRKKQLEKASKSTNLIIDIALNSTKPIVYKNREIDVTIRPDLKLWKESGRELELLGRIAIIKGRYTQQDKIFEILPGELLFGGEIENPYLNIKAKYSYDPYIIDIDISGRVDTPIINFSSNPYLSQSDILSILLFNSTTNSLLTQKSNSTNSAISFFGNVFAKEILSKFGVNLDRLVLRTNEEGGFGVEIGKRISKKVTIIYINDIVQTIKVKYQHSPHFESDLTISPESSGIDFIYKSEH